ncbi:MAG: EAL domain-containing protein, partial [Ilumatobacter sp.]
RLGCRLAIDDFGTGYSALSYLRRFSVDVLKIDQSFVGDIGDSPEATALVEAILGMARALGIITIAEGVENARQAQLLGDLGCDYAQGYHFGRPMPAHELGGTGAELMPGRAVGNERAPA